jgi:hypothetical protein
MSLPCIAYEQGAHASVQAVRLLSHISHNDTLKSISFAYFWPLMKYGIIFWGNASHSKKVFSLQKKIVRIMTDVKPRDSCRD